MITANALGKKSTQLYENFDTCVKKKIAFSFKNQDKRKALTVHAAVAQQYSVVVVVLVA